VSNPNKKLSTKLDGSPHKLELKYIKSMIKTQVDGDAEPYTLLMLKQSKFSLVWLFILEII
jgi:hypothetical protein